MFCNYWEHVTCFSSKSYLEWFVWEWAYILPGCQTWVLSNPNFITKFLSSSQISTINPNFFFLPFHPASKPLLLWPHDWSSFNQTILDLINLLLPSNNNLSQKFSNDTKLMSYTAKYGFVYNKLMLSNEELMTTTNEPSWWSSLRSFWKI